ncbi:uncharacterized protein LOC117102529 [Anneissia japonica]|uniref:uncharacterized protein LOC117102529 n=1 Tax=Anneissia japonica TaxID=1529436 RepID=UPI0014258820|nr:uncharacterized protein LOC117102529 [Anneissia japonica]
MLSYGMLVLTATALVGIQACEETQVELEVFSNRSVLVQFEIIPGIDRSRIPTNDTQPQKYRFHALLVNSTMYENATAGSWKTCVGSCPPGDVCKGFFIPGTQVEVLVFINPSALVNFEPFPACLESRTVGVRDLTNDTQPEKCALQGIQRNSTMYENALVGSVEACVGRCPPDAREFCKGFLNISEAITLPATTTAEYVEELMMATTTTASTSPYYQTTPSPTHVKHSLIYIRIAIYIGVCVLVCLLLIFVLNRLTIRPKKDIVHTYVKTSQEVLVNEP